MANFVIIFLALAVAFAESINTRHMSQSTKRVAKQHAIQTHSCRQIQVNKQKYTREKMRQGTKLNEIQYYVPESKNCIRGML